MFDDLANKENIQPNKPPVAGGNKEKIVSTEDIFANIDETTAKSPKPEIFKAKEAPAGFSTADQATVEAERHRDNLKKIIFLSGIVLFFLVFLVGGYLLYAKYFRQSSLSGGEKEVEEAVATPAGQNTPPSESTPAEKAKNDSVSEPAPAEQAKQAEALDSDQDGLSDEEETQLRTDVGKVDTDDDGLFDREEAKVYKTDPLNKDTDKDGFFDGQEVQGGYNPLGTGTLYKL